MAEQVFCKNCNSPCEPKVVGNTVYHWCTNRWCGLRMNGEIGPAKGYDVITDSHGNIVWENPQLRHDPEYMKMHAGTTTLIPPAPKTSVQKQVNQPVAKPAAPVAKQNSPRQVKPVLFHHRFYVYDQKADQYVMRDGTLDYFTIRVVDTLDVAYQRFEKTHAGLPNEDECEDTMSFTMSDIIEWLDDYASEDPDSGWLSMGAADKDAVGKDIMFDLLYGDADFSAYESICEYVITNYGDNCSAREEETEEEESSEPYILKGFVRHTVNPAEFYLKNKATGAEYNYDAMSKEIAAIYKKLTKKDISGSERRVQGLIESVCEHIGCVNAGLLDDEPIAKIVRGIVFERDVD